MKKIIAIIQTGQPIKSIYDQYGDFNQWIIESMQIDSEKIKTYRIYKHVAFPDPYQISGVIITGSPAMVTEKRQWSEACKDWLRPIINMDIPILGICYGHQLLAQLLGGEAGWNPNGREIGQVKLTLAAQASEDKLLGHLPLTDSKHINFYATHQQSVLKLPPDSTLLATTKLDPYHCFRYRNHIWGLQFHPEFSAGVIKSYIRERADDIKRDGLNPKQLVKKVTENNNGTLLLTRFKEICFMPNKRG